MVEIISKNNFDDSIIQSDRPVLVDFWAEWCGPCRMISPIVDEIAHDIDSIKVCKINVDDERDLAISYGIESIPTLLIIKNGEVADKLVGYNPRETIEKFINENI